MKPYLVWVYVLYLGAASCVGGVPWLDILSSDPKALEWYFEFYTQKIEYNPRLDLQLDLYPTMDIDGVPHIQYPLLLKNNIKVWAFVPQIFAYNPAMMQMIEFFMTLSTTLPSEETDLISAYLGQILHGCLHGNYGLVEQDSYIIFLKTARRLFSVKAQQLFINWAHGYLKAIRGADYLSDAPVFHDDKMSFFAYHTIHILDLVPEEFA